MYNFCIGALVDNSGLIMKNVQVNHLDVAYVIKSAKKVPYWSDLYNCDLNTV